MNFPIFMLNRMNFGKFHADPHEILADPQTFKFKNMLISKDIGYRKKACAHGWMTGLPFFSESSSPVYLFFK